MLTPLPGVTMEWGLLHAGQEAVQEGSFPLAQGQVQLAGTSDKLVQSCHMVCLALPHAPAALDPGVRHQPAPSQPHPASITPSTDHSPAVTLESVISLQQTSRTVCQSSYPPIRQSQFSSDPGIRHQPAPSRFLCANQAIHQSGNHGSLLLRVCKSSWKLPLQMPCPQRSRTSSQSELEHSGPSAHHVYLMSKAPVSGPPGD